MSKKRQSIIKKINISLGILVIILLALLLSNNGMTGKVVLNDPSNSQCRFIADGISQEISMDYCCYDIQSMIVCSHQNTGEIKCFSSEKGDYYLVNQDALDYCAKEGYHVSTE